MIWLVWRRCRAALLVALAVAALAAVALVVARTAALGAARDLGAEPCLANPDQVLCGVHGEFLYTLYTGSLLIRFSLVALPAVVGGIAGAGLFGGEFERRTHVLALTQTVSRTRWWLVGLLVAGVPAVLAVTAVTAVASWAVEPFTGMLVRTPLDPLWFLPTGIVPVGYTLLAFIVAANAGLVLRSTLGALAVTAAVHLAVVFGLQVRDHYLPPETWRADLLPPGQGDITWQLPPLALDVDYGYLDQDGRELDTGIGAVAADCAVELSYSDCLRQNGVTGLYARYQPDSRYWPFQLIETAVLGLLAALVLTGGRWGLRRNRT